MWIKTGVTDVKHISEKTENHEKSMSHMNNAVELESKRAAQLDEGYRLGIREHEEADRNRHILSKITDCVKFCGAFEQTLRGHDESEGSQNPGVFRGLVDFAVLQEHLQAAVFKGTSKTEGTACSQLGDNASGQTLPPSWLTKQLSTQSQLLIGFEPFHFLKALVNVLILSQG